MITLEYEINTKPVPQARPRFFVRCKKCKFRHLKQTGVCERCKSSVGAYDPDKSKSFKEDVAWHTRIVAVGKGLREPLKAPIVLSLTFQLGRNGKERFHTKKPDLSNLTKLIEDALTGIIYHDDSQIVESHLYKQYGDPCVKVKIEALEVE